MAQAMLSFFDEKYFSDDCTCDLSKTSNRWAECCTVHNKNTTESSHEKEVLNNNVRAPPEDVSLGLLAPSKMVIPVEINQSFPRQPSTNYLINMIEYRIKMLVPYDVKFHPGEVKKIQTNTHITRKAGKLSLLVKPGDNLPLRFLSEGLINPSFRGVLTVLLQNPSSNDIYLSAGNAVGYLILSPFIE